VNRNNAVHCEGLSGGELGTSGDQVGGLARGKENQASPAVEAEAAFASDLVEHLVPGGMLLEEVSDPRIVPEVQVYDDPVCGDRDFSLAIIVVEILDYPALVDASFEMICSTKEMHRSTIRHQDDIVPWYRHECAIKAGGNGTRVQGKTVA
jgi:hypothetical protein